MVWKEIETASKENRREIALVGKDISTRLEKTGLDKSLFNLIHLNYLKISETTLSELPDEIGKLINLQTLMLHKNKIEHISFMVWSLTKLKFLDLSHNALTSIPEDVSKFTEIDTIDVSFNKLESFPKLSDSTKLKVLKLRNNNLKVFPDICYPQLKDLAELDLCNNEIQEVPANIKVLANLKICLIKANKIAELPAELGDCGKIKEIDLKENPLKDKRLAQTIDKETSTKKILDYIKKNCKRIVPLDDKAGKTVKVGKVKGSEEKRKETDVAITVMGFDNDFCIKVTKSVDDVRRHIIACFVLNVQFTPEKFRDFIKLQTKLHEEDCAKRTKATIATHNLAALLPNVPLIYTALKPNELKINPLNDKQEITGTALVKKLKDVAEEERKEKKRSKFTGVHKYLHLLDDLKEYPALITSENKVISFPPITNSDITKISFDTKNILIEVTSSTSLFSCRSVADKLLKSMTQLFGNITVQQVRILNEKDGSFRLVYPSLTDLVIKGDENIFVDRNLKN